MKELINRGYAEEAPGQDLNFNDGVWYIPHHGVYRPKKPDKIRVVLCIRKNRLIRISDK